MKHSREPERARQVGAGAMRQDGHDGLGVDGRAVVEEAIGHFKVRAIAPDTHNAREAVAQGRAGELDAVARVAGLKHGHLAKLRTNRRLQFRPAAARAPMRGVWIHDDGDAVA